MWHLMQVPIICSSFLISARCDGFRFSAAVQPSTEKLASKALYAAFLTQWQWLYIVAGRNVYEAEVRRLARRSTIVKRLLVAQFHGNRLPAAVTVSPSNERLEEFVNERTLRRQQIGAPSQRLWRHRGVQQQQQQQPGTRSCVMVLQRRGWCQLNDYRSQEHVAARSLQNARCLFISALYAPSTVTLSICCPIPTSIISPLLPHPLRAQSTELYIIHSITAQNKAASHQCISRRPIDR